MFRVFKRLCFPATPLSKEVLSHICVDRLSECRVLQVAFLGGLNELSVVPEQNQDVVRRAFHYVTTHLQQL